MTSEFIPSKSERRFGLFELDWSIDKTPLASLVQLPPDLRGWNEDEDRIITPRTRSEAFKDAAEANAEALAEADSEDPPRFLSIEWQVVIEFSKRSPIGFVCWMNPEGEGAYQADRHHYTRIVHPTQAELDAYPAPVGVEGGAA